jgi:MFS family permease
MQSLLSKWLPPNERGKLSTIVYSGKEGTSHCFPQKLTDKLITCYGTLGIPAGTALTMVVTGYLIECFGWPSVFYGIGSASLVWFFFWTLLVSSTPSTHPRISYDELEYIKASIGEHNSKVLCFY